MVYYEESRRKKEARRKKYSIVRRELKFGVEVEELIH